jgi:hypothetical protein
MNNCRSILSADILRNYCQCLLERAAHACLPEPVIWMSTPWCLVTLAARRLVPERSQTRELTRNELTVLAERIPLAVAGKLMDSYEAS